jgi:hypothetical protein
VSGARAEGLGPAFKESDKASDLIFGAAALDVLFSANSLSEKISKIS